MSGPDCETSRPRSTGRGSAGLRTWLILAVLAAVGLGGAVVFATNQLTGIDEPAVATGRAERLVQAPVGGDVVTVFNIGELRPEVATAVSRAASSAGGSWSRTRSASLGLLSVRRDGRFVQRAPEGYRYPLVITAMPANVAGAVLGRDLAAGLEADGVVMGERTARLRNAQPGDVIDVLAADGTVRSLRISLVMPDAQVGGAEVIMSTAAADSVGITLSTRALIWGFSSRTAIELALRSNGIGAGLRETRAVRSWDAPNPDSTLGTARTKELLGEFAFFVNDNSSITQDGAWVAANLPPTRELLNSTIAIEARCHRAVVGDLRAALAAVAAAGLADEIDLDNSNIFGGCHNPRFNRLSGESGFVSRHAWAMALDVNTQTNAQGDVPQMNCDVVRIFRRHGFAWGGNFLRPDGMHFEWVGSRRDLMSYPSSYCPNIVPPGLQSVQTGDSWELLFADDTLATGHDHAHD